jgi:hypothetical protein
MAITWVLVFRLFESFCGVKEEDPPSAVGGLGRWVCRSGWAYMFSVCGAGLEDGCVYILKAHGLRSMGLLFLLLIEKYNNLIYVSSSIMLLIN